jgi:hypothetical protein
VTDIVDFRVSDTLAVGHDALQVIIFRKESDNVAIHNKHPRFDGAVWKAVRFIHISKKMLLVHLREFGWREPVESCSHCARGACLTGRASGGTSSPGSRITAPARYVTVS